MNTKKKRVKKPMAQTRKLRDLPTKKNPKGGFGGAPIGPVGPGG
jgi:hypothetical protein